MINSFIKKLFLFVVQWSKGDTQSVPFLSFLTGGARHYLTTTSTSATVSAFSSTAASFMKRAGALQVVTWNVAAINNNPFEYWITYNDEYEKLMIQIEQFINSPTEAQDVPVHQVFTPDMFRELNQELTETAKWKSVAEYWEKEYSNRKIVSEFLKDPLLGSKRLASMPDRITNTINLANGDAVFRPTVINMYQGQLDNQQQWWKAWKEFMFRTPLSINDKNGQTVQQVPYQMLQPISPAKYPDITTQEAQDSLPLQTLCGAIFDAILVHMMNECAASPQAWQALKKTMVEKLNQQKSIKTLNILAQSPYLHSDIVTLQEVSMSLVEQARKHAVLAKDFHILVSSEYLDPVRDQNSVIFLNKESFPAGIDQEITSQVMQQFDENVPVAVGDVLAVTATNQQGDRYVIASFHGDTNGLATKPVVQAVNAIVPAGHTLIFGLDANTYEHGKPGRTQDVLEFAQFFSTRLHLTSCWGDTVNPSNYTTFNARTFLQPQLQKGCRSTEKRSKGDVNPKDFILFPEKTFAIQQTWKDNTGEAKYTENMAFPTLDFPSDHGILATVLEKNP